MKPKLKSPFWLSLVGTLSLSLPLNANSNSNLTVEIVGLGNRQGQVCLNLFASSRGFPDKRENAVQGQCVQITDTPLRVTFTNLPPKTYAVAAFWDNNSDRQLNRNFLGIPTEKFGFSSNPVIRGGPPKFQESAVIVIGPNTNIQIQLQSVI
jgi:uncharacterized protein (DUF2141 family)